MKLGSNDRFAPSLGIDPYAPENNNRVACNDWLLADRGVKTVFVALPDLADPADVLRLAPVAAAFA